MKKRFILTLIFSLALAGLQTEPAQAGFVGSYKARISANREFKNTQQEIKEIFVKQDKFTNAHDLDKLSDLYDESFVNNDGFDKKLYFKLIKDTWETYPEIQYDTVIRDIQIDGDYASVQTFETALAVTHEQSEKVDAYGELRSNANSIYYLKKSGKKWQIVSEQVLSEKSQLKYGDARFIKMDLNAPRVINAGEEYSAELSIALADDESGIASIDKQLVIHPLDKPEEAFRAIGADSELERIFTANKKNINEYATASIGIAKSEPYDENHSKVYMSGIAFLMSRVNVIPQNNFIKEEDENAQKTK